MGRIAKHFIACARPTHALDNATGLTDAHFRQMKQQNMAMIPTLKLFQGDPDVVAEVRAFFKIGGQILFGTHVGFLSDVNPTSEYELLARAGLTWRDILASLTTNPASLASGSEHVGFLTKPSSPRTLLETSGRY